LCCILENYQQEDGIRVPKVLQKYIPGQPEFLPFTKDLPKDTTSAKVKGEASGSKPKVAKPGDVTDKMKEMSVKK
jgi:seryl-tRNA synthetase